MIFEGFDGVDDFWRFWWFLFFVWSVSEGRAWWFGFWLMADDGARFAVAVVNDGGLIVDGGLGCEWEDFKRREKCEGWRK